ncbi:hypothetical protein ACFQH8_05410 [Halomicroarcula sp. GCM10025710]
METPEPHTDAESSSLPYTDSPVWQYPGPSHSRHEDPLLFDTDADPNQDHNLANERPELAGQMRSLLTDAMAVLEAPGWQYERLDLEP